MSDIEKHEEGLDELYRSLKYSHDKLEKGVETRTKELKRANEKLQKQIENREKIEHKLRECEQRYRTAIDNSNDGIAILRDGHHLYVNKRYLEIYGYDSIEEIEKTGVYNLIHPDDKELVYKTSHARVRGELEGESYEHKCIKKDGGTIHVEVSVASFIYENKPAGLAFIRDITNRKIIEGKLKKAHEELETRVEERTRELAEYRDHLEQMVEDRTAEIRKLQKALIKKEQLAILGRLIATIAHEIRNPLGTVNTSIFSIRSAFENNQPERFYRVLQLAERNIQRCDGIITDLLDFTRTVNLRPRLVKIDEWLEDLLNELTFPEDIVCSRVLNCSMEIHIDTEQLRRAIVNIISNAIHALSDENSPGKELKVETHASENYLKIQISDTGIGISEDIYEKMFEPLFSTKSFGVGLGLSVAKDVLEKHQGEISIKSREGVGTTVVLRIPLHN